MAVIYQEGVQHVIAVYSWAGASDETLDVSAQFMVIGTGHFYSTNFDAMLGITVQGTVVTIDPGGGHNPITGFLMLQGEGHVS